MIVFYILIGVACVLLILIVLVQNPKGGGLASSFASSNQIMGVKKTNDFLEKATWTLAAVVAIFSIVSSLTTNNADITHSRIEDRILNDMPDYSTESEGILPEATDALPFEEADIPDAE